MYPQCIHRDCHGRSYGCAMTSYKFDGPECHRVIRTRGQYRLGT